jgi:hypothetical protein
VHATFFLFLFNDSVAGGGGRWSDLCGRFHEAQAVSELELVR